MPSYDKPTATIEKQLLLTFSLPGVSGTSHTWSGPQEQLRETLNEHWTLRVLEENVDQTIQSFEAVVETLKSFRSQLKGSR